MAVVHAPLVRWHVDKLVNCINMPLRNFKKHIKATLHRMAEGSQSAQSLSRDRVRSPNDIKMLHILPGG